MIRTLVRLLSSGGKFIGLGLALVLVLSALWQLVDRVFISAGTASGPSQSQAVYAELNGDTTTLWLSPADEPGRKERIAEIDHQEGYGIRGSLSPDGASLVYTVLPSGCKDPTLEALLWVMNIESGQQRLLVEGVDLRAAPVFSSDEQKVLYRRRTEMEGGGEVIELCVMDLATSLERRIVRDELALGLYPIGWSQDGTSIYYSRVSSQGTDVIEAEVSTGATSTIGHVSDGVARDFHLSPDGKAILYSAWQSGDTYAVGVLDIVSREEDTLIQGSNDHYSPIWRPMGGVVTLSTESTDPIGQGRLLSMTAAQKAPLSTISTPEGGFDLPLAWSSNELYLAVRSLQGMSSSQITSEGIVIVSPSDGRRYELETSGYVQFIGWLASD